MKFLLVTLGSVGDILPFLGVAETLRQRRHRVIIASNKATWGAPGLSNRTSAWPKLKSRLDGVKPFAVRKRHG